MGFIGRLFGSQKAIDAGISGLDKIFYTDEEKAENKLKAAPWKIKLLKAYEPFKLAQRILAITYSVPYILAWVSCYIASFWINVDVQKEILGGQIAYINITIIGFYFGGGAVEGLIREAKKK